MKRTLILAIAALAASSAFAQDIDFQPYGFVSAVMREAKADQQRAATHTDRARAQVRAEALEAARLGLLNATEAANKQPTAEQSRQIEQAGQRVVDVGSK